MILLKSNLSYNLNKKEGHMIKKLFVILVFIMINFSCTANAEESQGPVVKDLGPQSDVNNKILFAKVETHRNLHSRKYVLGPNDIINVNVLGSTDLTQSSVRVQPDGKINLTYFENLNVTGMSIDDLQSLIKERYSEYLVDPQITITLSQSKPFIVYISGAIFNPGAYELNTITNSTPYSSKPEAFIERKTPLLSNIIVSAGGLSYDADLEHIHIKNDIDGSSFDVNVYDVIENANSSEDAYLMAGDRVTVPRLPSPSAIDDKKYRELCRSTYFQKQIPVRIIGYVNNPGLIQLSSSDSASLNSAIASAGGYASGAAYIPKKVYISRLDGNSKLITHAFDPAHDDIALRPNDIVYVPEKFRPLVGKGFDYMLRIIAPFYTLTNTYYSMDLIKHL